MNAYKVWNEDAGYLLIVAPTRSKAKAIYNSYIETESFTDPCHIQLLEKDVEFPEGERTREYGKSREMDLMLSGIIAPDWYEMMWYC